VSEKHLILAEQALEGELPQLAVVGKFCNGGRMCRPAGASFFWCARFPTAGAVGKRVVLKK